MKTSQTVSFSSRRWTIIAGLRAWLSFALIFVGCSSASAIEGYYLVADPPYYYFGSNPAVTANAMSVAIAAKMGKPISVVNTTFPSETTSYPPNSNLLAPASNGTIKNLDSGATPVTGIVSGQLRLSGTETIGVSRLTTLFYVSSPARSSMTLQLRFVALARIMRIGASAKFPLRGQFWAR